MLLLLAMIEAPEDKRKFERLYLAYHQTMFYAAYRILKDQQKAEDAVHQAFIKIIDLLEKINENDCHKTRSFFVIIVERVAIDSYRKEKKELSFSYDQLEIYIGDPRIESYGEADALTAMIKRLPSNYADVLRLRFAEGYSDSEIASMLEITEENVRQRISRGKKRLGEILEKEGEACG